MILLPSSAEMARIDTDAQQDFAFPGILLMENAARALFDALIDFAREQQTDMGRLRVLFLAGPGNNGGDALAVARMWYCRVGVKPRVFLTAEPAHDSSAAVHLETIRKLEIPVVEGLSRLEEELQTADWVIDGLLGTGLKGTLREDAERLIQAVNAAETFTIAVDIPSGVSDDFDGSRPAVRADLTLCVELPKLSIYTETARPICGDVRTVALGFPHALLSASAHPQTARLLVSDDIAGLVPAFHAFSHKYSRGAVLVFAGSEEYSGAAVLSCNAALRSGAGYLRLMTRARGLDGLDPAIVRSSEPSSAGALQELPVSRYQAALVGPGWGRHADRVEQLSELLQVLPPGVLDADAIWALGRRMDDVATGTHATARCDATARTENGHQTGSRPVTDGWILTPHHGEFRFLGFGELPPDAESRRSIACRVAQELGAVLVLKGPQSWIVAPDGRIAVYDGADAFLATAGTGDVLSGCIASLRACGAPPFEAACAGVLLLGAASRHAVARVGVFTATDLPSAIGCIRAEMSEQILRRPHSNGPEQQQ